MKLVFSRPMIVVVTAGFCLLGLSSCVPLAVGAAAGYIARDEGFGLQSPVTRDN